MYIDIASEFCKFIDFGTASLAYMRVP